MDRLWDRGEKNRDHGENQENPFPAGGRACRGGFFWFSIKASFPAGKSAAALQNIQLGIFFRNAAYTIEKVTRLAARPLGLFAWPRDENIWPFPAKNNIRWNAGIMKLWKQFKLQKYEDIDYYDTRGNFPVEDFACRLNELIMEELDGKDKAGVMFLCIGTDRSTGDSLGPLVGHKLRRRRLRRAAVLGTLERPVHAMNLGLYIKYIRMHYPDYVVVAIDASVGSHDHVGYATLGRGALKPGLGVSKELEAVGDISITGIVGGCGGQDPVMLQSVRLSMVMQMADCICESILLVERFWENKVMV